MTTAKRQPGLGRGLGELFQRTDLPVDRRQDGRAAESPVGDRRADDRPRPANDRVEEHRPAHAATEDSRHEANGRGTGGPEADGRETDGPEAGGIVRVPDGAYFTEVAIDAIRPNPKQPRSVFDQDQLSELVESIREVGVLQPVVVRPLDDGFELVMGERRLRAAKDAGLDTIPAIVRATEDHALLRDALLENLHRVQLNPLEEAAAYQQMLAEFDCTQDELSQRIKRSRPQISNTIRLLRLPPTVQRRVAAGVLSAGHARALLVVDDPAGQERLAQRIVSEGLSVRAVEELVTLGNHDEPSRRSRAPRETPRKATEVAERLSDHFETRVKVQMGRSRGRITIEFASGTDLDRIIELMKIDSEI